ncbi:MAG: PilZ domain-containing protein [Candidatus Omnitrophica bacterium]|nr:PilZ domain-containing protein [Candidatus Omnitrophota bacterium]MBU1997673.1 PilZ domain-containing protein [Candidatus Omnitrophota bacterium]MBU4333800.1 PilZ domain-containing protein [Candidatus Omnitrophota bacterium]
MSFNDSRFDFRVNARKKISWFIDEKGANGKGYVRNISSSGMLLEIDSDLAPTDRSFFAIDTSTEEDSFIPKKGQLVWSKKKGFSKRKYLCGIEFIEPTQKILLNLKNKIKEKISQLDKINTITNFISLILALAIIGLTAYTVSVGVETYNKMSLANIKMFAVSSKQATLTQNYASLYRDSELRLLEATQELNASSIMFKDVTADLEMTKAILVQTETMLADARNDMANKMQTEISNLTALKEKELAAVRAELVAQIKVLEDKSIDLKGEIALLDSNLKYYEGNIKNIGEGKVLLQLYHDNMNLVKSKIKDFKIEAKLVRTQALREMDRVRVLLGNNGYFIKNGEVVKVDIESYNSAVMNAGAQVEIKVENFK